MERYNLGSLYPLNSLQKRIQQLEEQRLVNKRGASPFLAKRPRPSDSSATVLLPQHKPSNYAPNVPSPLPQTHYPPHFGPADQSPYAGLASPYGLIPNPTRNSLSYPIGLYSSADSANYVRPVPYGGYSNSGFPPYDLSSYP